MRYGLGELIWSRALVSESGSTDMASHALSDRARGTSFQQPRNERSSSQTSCQCTILSWDSSSSSENRVRTSQSPTRASSSHGWAEAYTWYVHSPHKLRSFRCTCGRTNRINQYTCYKKIIQQHAPACLRVPRLTTAFLPSIHPSIFPLLRSRRPALSRAYTTFADIRGYDDGRRVPQGPQRRVECHLSDLPPPRKRI